MRCVALLALLALAVLALGYPAAGAARAPSDDDGVVLTAVAASGDGGVPAGFAGGDSGGTPATWDGESSGDDSPTLVDDGTTSDSTDTAASVATTTGSGGALAASAGGPSARAAQEPTPQPEGAATQQPGAGTQQPGDPGTQPPPSETPGAAALAGQAPAAGTGGGLPVTGIEVLQLALLGIALFLVGARLRVLALRRRRGSYIPYEEDVERPITVRRAEPAPPRRAERAPPRRAERAPPRRAERDEWSFPDPHEPAPTGLLPSTASARRRARVLAAERDSAH